MTVTFNTKFQTKKIPEKYMLKEDCECFIVIPDSHIYLRNSFEHHIPGFKVINKNYIHKYSKAETYKKINMIAIVIEKTRTDIYYLLVGRDLEDFEVNNSNYALKLPFYFDNEEDDDIEHAVIQKHSYVHPKYFN